MNKKFTDQERITIVAAIRKGIEKTKHHTKYTSRVVAAIKAEVCAAFGVADDQMVVYSEDKGNASLGSISIWGNGVHSGEKMYLCWNWNKAYTSSMTTPHWSAPLLEECKRCDMRDYVERQQEEAKYHSNWSEREDRIIYLQQQIELIRKQSLADCAGMPVPRVAIAENFRSADHFWTGPTCAAREKFKVLFGK